MFYFLALVYSTVSLFCSGGTATVSFLLSLSKLLSLVNAFTITQVCVQYVVVFHLSVILVTVLFRHPEVHTPGKTWLFMSGTMCPG